MTGRLPLLLFGATVLTTTIAGSWLAGADVTTDPLALLKGLPFSAALLGILGAHECAHYLASRRHGVKATLPLFIPAPLPPVGTFGAIIRIKSRIPDRGALLEIGAALPLAVIGLKLSELVSFTPSGGGEAGFSLGSSLIFLLLEKAVLGERPGNVALILHPVAFAAWFGFFVTAMNLLPIGQLDGGHVLHALLRRGRAGFTRLLLFLLIPLGFFWPGWLFWGGLMCILGFRHPPVVSEAIPLGRRQKILGLLAAAVLALTFTPVPFIIF